MSFYNLLIYRFEPEESCEGLEKVGNEMKKANNDCFAFMRQTASRQREGARSLNDPLLRLRNLAPGNR